jgi:hypothetical protein
MLQELKANKHCRYLHRKSSRNTNKLNWATFWATVSGVTQVSGYTHQQVALSRTIQI